MLTSINCKATFFASLVLFASSAYASNYRLFDCDNTFKNDLSHEELVERFGDSNVSVSDIHLGEGFYEKGTTLYANDPELTVEITWKNLQERSRPDVIKISQRISDWKTPEGITPGIDLLTLEKINKSPFQLAGFEWDYGGTVYSWENGALVSTNNDKCRLLIRMSVYGSDTAENAELYYQVLGKSAFSSETPAMRVLNPRVDQMLLIYE
ncbi:MAG: hypothetical protein NXI15_16790 [Gammaproteobacteria bacterium]|nr:hypothetical protein [Gammaproteobacteria bacterium]